MNSQQPHPPASSSYMVLQALVARRSVPPSNMSLLGMVRHMAGVENNWFQHVLQHRHDAPRLYDVPGGED